MCVWRMEVISSMCGGLGGVWGWCEWGMSVGTDAVGMVVGEVSLGVDIVVVGPVGVGCRSWFDLSGSLMGKCRNVLRL